MPLCSVSEWGWDSKSRMKSLWQNSGVGSLVSIFMRCNCYTSASCASQGNHFALQGSTVIIYSWEERRTHNGGLNCHCCSLVHSGCTRNCWLYDQRKNCPAGNRWGEIAASLKPVSLALQHSQSQTLLTFICKNNPKALKCYWQRVYKGKHDSRELRTDCNCNCNCRLQ